MAIGAVNSVPVNNTERVVTSEVTNPKDENNIILFPNKFATTTPVETGENIEVTTAPAPDVNAKKKATLEELKKTYKEKSKKLAENIAKYDKMNEPLKKGAGIGFLAGGAVSVVGTIAAYVASGMLTIPAIVGGTVLGGLLVAPIVGGLAGSAFGLGADFYSRMTNDEYLSSSEREEFKRNNIDALQGEINSLKSMISGLEAELKQ